MQENAQTQQSQTEEPIITFDSLGLKPQLLKSIKFAGFTAPSPIQAQAIPVVLICSAGTQQHET